MKFNKYIKMSAIASLLMLSQQAFSTALLNTTSSYYNFVGGGSFINGEVRGQTTSGELTQLNVENGSSGWLNLYGEGSKIDQYGWKYGGTGWAEISSKGDNLRFFMGQDYIYSESYLISEKNFSSLKVEWQFDVLYDDAWVEQLVLFPGASSDNFNFNIFNMTTRTSLFSYDGSDNMKVFSSNPPDIFLQQGHHYLISTFLSNSVYGAGDGEYSEIDIVFANSVIKLPTPSSGLLFIFAILFFGYSRKRLKK